MSNELKQYVVRATDVIFGRLGPEVRLEFEDFNRFFEQGKTEEHTLPLLAHQAQQLARDGYSVTPVEQPQTEKAKK